MAKAELKGLETGAYFDMILKLAVKSAQTGEGEILFSKKDLERLPEGFEEMCIRDSRILSAADIGKGAANANRNHDLLLYHIGLLNRTDDVAAAYLVARICSGYELSLIHIFHRLNGALCCPEFHT